MSKIVNKYLEDNSEKIILKLVELNMHYKPGPLPSLLPLFKRYRDEL